MGCGVSKSEYSDLKAQNDLLKNQVTDLKSRLNEISYLEDHSQVVLPNTELLDIESSFNGQPYQIKVQLPRNYYQTKEKLPVLYVTDAETNFGGVGYIVQRLIKDKLIPPMIVVGIAYGTDYKTFYELRSRDLTPTIDSDLKLGGKTDPTGGAPEFCNFLAEELFPLIEENYRVDGDDRTLYGHSYGGLFGSYVLLNRSDLFNNYLILSPSLWFNDTMMLNQVDTFANGFINTKVYMASGELEGRIDDLQTDFSEKLIANGLEGLNLKAEVMENETHRTIFGPGFTDGMRYLFQ